METEKIKIWLKCKNKHFPFYSEIKHEAVKTKTRAETNNRFIDQMKKKVFFLAGNVFLSHVTLN